MGKLSPFYIFNFAHVHCLLLILLIAQYSRVIWAPSMKKEHQDAIHSTKSLEMVCCTAWHSCRKLQYKYFRVFGYQPENSAEDFEMVG